MDTDEPAGRVSSNNTHSNPFKPSLEPEWATDPRPSSLAPAIPRKLAPPIPRKPDALVTATGPSNQLDLVVPHLRGIQSDRTVIQSSALPTQSTFENNLIPPPPTSNQYDRGHIKVIPYGSYVSIETPSTRNRETEIRPPLPTRIAATVPNLVDQDDGEVSLPSLQPIQPR
jgi:hypothetical protein